MTPLKGRTLFITGASRGIGLAIAKRAARDGANVVIAAKSHVANPKLPGTIYTAADEIEAAGGKALPLKVDVREEAEVQAAVAQAVERFGGIDIVVNNASAIWLAGLSGTPMKRYDLMHQVNVRGSYLCTQACLPHLKRALNPHVLMLAPPINLASKWFAHHTAYTMSKYGMSLAAFGLAAELAKDGIAVNALWPRTVIDTAALAMLGGMARPENCRKPDIMADAAHWIFSQPARSLTGQFLLDEEVLRRAGVTDFSAYAVKPGAPLLPDLFLD